MMSEKNEALGTPNKNQRLFPWHQGVYDAHCHPTDIASSLDDIPRMEARGLIIMATRLQDQDLVMEANERLGMSSPDLSSTASCQILPAFGWHPWFSHQLYDDRQDPEAPAPSKLDHYKLVVSPSPKEDTFIRGLPDPRPLSKHLAQTQAALVKCPLAMVGEIGLDKSFRIPQTTDAHALREPEPGKTPGTRDGRRLSPYRVDIGHQRTILAAQLQLAGTMSRAVSVHGVAAHGILLETLQNTWKGYENHVPSKRQLQKQGINDPWQLEAEDESATEAEEPKSKPFPPRICLHSYSGPPEQLNQYLHKSVPAKVFFSFSTAINFSTPASDKAIAVIKALPSDRILVESDLHCAGQQMDNALEEMTRMVCQFKDWTLEDGVQQLANNWKHFAFGNA